MADKIFIGQGKEKVFDDGGSIIRLSFGPKDTKKINEIAAANGGWVNIDISKRREVSDKGYTHYGTLNEWKPKKNAEEMFPRESVPF